MSSAGTRTRSTYEERVVGGTISFEEWLSNQGKIALPSKKTVQTGKQITVSESHPRSRDGSYREGGPFFTSRVTSFLNPGYVRNCYLQQADKLYTGPLWGNFPSNADMVAIGYKNVSQSFGDKNESQMMKDGTNAISYCNPINPASNLGTSLAESVREGLPSLPGIQLWKSKTQFLRGLGSEYLNYQFGWAPLQDEVHSVVSAARHHRDLLQQYQRGEGSDTHRTFEYPLQRTSVTLPSIPWGSWEGLNHEWNTDGSRQISLVKETKRWFEGCFTYALPSSTDNWRKALGFGSDADQLFGLALSPDILWELTPWSWAADWFSNAGEVINNVTNFGLAGLVLRYGYMMEESIERVTAEGKCPSVMCRNYIDSKHFPVIGPVPTGTYKCGYETVTKRRIPASPFGFSIGWEGLSPTQLAITAALGITRLL